MCVAAMGAPVGNKNGAKGRQWEIAIRRELALAEGSVSDGLRKIAKQIISKACEGDAWAIDHIANRIDGKAIERAEHVHQLNVAVSDEPALAGKLSARLANRAAETPTVQ